MSGGVAVMGVNTDFHDSAACVVRDGDLVAAVEEERFSRRKHDPGLPMRSMAWCCHEAGVDPVDLAAIAVASKPFTTYERILVSASRTGPRGFPQLRRALVTWTRTKLWSGYRIERALGLSRPPPVHFVEHHCSHAASAFYPSPFDSAAVLTVDGVGEWATTSIAHGRGSSLDMLREIRYPHSLGLLYTAMTVFCGMDANDGEQKLMGLAPYGSPTFVDVLRDRVLTLLDDGSFRVDGRYLAVDEDGMVTPRLSELLGGPALTRGHEPGQREADIARSVQVVLEDAMLSLVRSALLASGERRLVLAGGVALNCVANRAILDSGLVDDLWIQPAAGDAGTAVGAALWTWHGVLGHERDAGAPDGMSGAFLGPRVDDERAAQVLGGSGLRIRRFDDDAARDAAVAEHLDNGAIVGWCVGRMEFGPRALGHRSILADPRDPSVIARINGLVKSREGFRPFAPSVLVEHAAEWFEIERDAPYMLLTAAVRGVVPESPIERAGMSFAARLEQPRSPIPACTHIDGSARIHTVDAQRNPEFHGLLSAFHRRTGCPTLLNTSFNRSGEPIVSGSEDALACAVSAGLDVLVVGRHLVDLTSARDSVET